LNSQAFFSQFFAAVAQPVFQVLGPAYSEAWFDLKGRTTATMIIAICLYNSLQEYECLLNARPHDSKPYWGCFRSTDLALDRNNKAICENSLFFIYPGRILTSSPSICKDSYPRYYIHRCRSFCFTYWQSTADSPQYAFRSLRLFIH
jgi:hypothetical protein